MKRLYTQSEFKNTKSYEFLSLECYCCGQKFEKKKYLIQRILNKENYNSINKTNVGKYCSFKCESQDLKGHLKKIVVCKNCDKQFSKQNNQIIKYPNHFCCRSCANTYNNTHKTKGTRVSKLEIWLHQQLLIIYPNLDIRYNEKSAINSELDIYIPKLKLAFELNGIFHYEPIYGIDKLKQIKSNDERKLQACIENGIEIVIINVSELNYWQPKKGEKYFNIIKEIINNKCACAGIGIQACLRNMCQ